MKLIWDDYAPEYAGEIETWMHDPAIGKYACDGSWIDENQYYLTSPEYEPGSTYFSKVISDGGRIVGAIILLTREGYPLTVNPLIVNPALYGKGYGSAIVGDLIKNLGSIIPFEVRQIEAGIDLGNTASIRVFEKNGFKLCETHPDGDFGYFAYKMPQS